MPARVHGRERSCASLPYRPTPRWSGRRRRASRAPTSSRAHTRPFPSCTRSHGETALHRTSRPQATRVPRKLRPFAVGNDVFGEPLALARIRRIRDSMARGGLVHCRDDPAVNSTGRPTPNPLVGRDGVAIPFQLAEAADVTIAVYDTAGTRVQTLVDQRLPAGASSRAWDGHGQSGQPVPSGIYYVRMQAAGAQESTSLVLLR